MFFFSFLNIFIIVDLLSLFHNSNSCVSSGTVAIYSVQFSRSVMPNSLQPHELQHTRPHCPSPTPGVHSDSRPSSQWCHPAISSSVIPFSSCPQSLPAPRSFPMIQHFTWGGQSTGVSALASFLPKSTQDWSPLQCTGWISLHSKRLSRVFSNTTLHQQQFLGYEAEELMLLNYGAGEDSWESLGMQGDQTSQR